MKKGKDLKNQDNEKFSILMLIPLNIQIKYVAKWTIIPTVNYKKLAHFFLYSFIKILVLLVINQQALKFNKCLSVVKYNERRPWSTFLD